MLIPAQFPKWAWGALAGGVALLALGHWQNQRVSYHEARAKLLGEQVKQLEAKLVQDQADLQQAQQAVQKAQEATEQVRVVYRTIQVPAKPPAPPAANPGLQAGLLHMGFANGLVVTDNLQSTLGHADALRIYEWGQEAQRVPALEAKVTAGEVLIEAQDHQIQALNDQSLVQQRTMADGQEAFSVQGQQVKDLQHEIALRKLEGWKKWAYGAAGVAVGIAVSKRH